jgi:Domain of unknown function (DUF1772)
MNFTILLLFINLNNLCMLVQNKLSNAVGLLTTGLLAGAFFYATFNVLPTFWEVGTDVHLGFRVALMRHNALNMPLLMAIGIAATIWFGWTIRHLKLPRIFACLAIALAIATLVITRFYNVPINLEIKTWLPTAPPGNWLAIMETWDFYHSMRTVTAIGSFLMVLIASFSSSQNSQQ